MEWGEPDDDDTQDVELWSLYAAVRYDSYRLDFVVQTAWRGILVIECDGHDWHDRTKQQAAYDRSRDRHLLLNGLSTIRFTGSEIVHSPERCAAEVYAIARKLDRREMAYVDLFDELSRLNRERQSSMES